MFTVSNSAGVHFDLRLARQHKLTRRLGLQVLCSVALHLLYLDQLDR